MKKMLYISNVGGSNFKVNFMEGTLNAVHKLKYDLYSVCNRSASNEKQMQEDGVKYGLKLLNADIARSPFSIKNIKAYRQINKIIEENDIEYIHCNTPIGGILGRLCGKKSRVKKVIYMAHGFHFYKGASLKNWILYYSAEKMLARWTDAIITINKEDFERAKKFELRGNGKAYHVHGVGINTAEFKRDDDIRKKKREELNIKDDDIVILSVGELNDNKNNKVIIDALAKLNNNKIHYFLCGSGVSREKLEAQAKMDGLSENVHFLGFRSDIKELYSASDIFVLPSFREGLSRSLMEAMAAGLPCVVSKIRGNEDLVKNGKNGYLCSVNSSEEFAEAINKLADDEALRENMKEENLKEICNYDVSAVSEEMEKIYTEVFE